MSQETKILGIVGVISIAMVVAAVLLLSKPADTPVVDERIDASRLIKEGSYQTSTQSAKVTLVEFSDFQCPACASAHPIIKRAIEEYPEDLNFVYRHFPLAIHPNAYPAAEAAEAAGEQGKFWQMHDLIFINQNDWANDSNPKSKFMEYAAELELNIEQFEQALDSGKFKDLVRRDYEDGVGLRVNSTPTFFLNGQRMNGVPRYEDLKNMIESEITSGQSVETQD